MRIVALLAAYNEERFIASCIEHFAEQGVEIYLLDNGSTDGTVAIAEKYRKQGLAGVESIRRDSCFALLPLLKRKEELCQELSADWFLHIDTDELHMPTPAHKTLAEALKAVDAQGYNAVNFLEYTFIPTKESPDHDHANFQETMRWYYPFLPSFPHRLNAWKRQSQPVELSWSAGHRVRFADLRMYPESFSMKHYLVLSREQAINKYMNRRRAEADLQMGWGRARAALKPESFVLPSQSELHAYAGNYVFDASNPRTKHFWDPSWQESCAAGLQAG